MNRFNIEETNLIHIFKMGTRREQIAKLQKVRPEYLQEPELLQILDSTIWKLATIGDTDFLNIPDPVFEEAGA